jgi:2-iminobutanoate/2-iminopropanoate deaminase
MSMVRSLLAVVLCAVGCAPAPKRVVLTDKAPPPIASYSQGIVDGDFVFVAGQGPVDPVSRKYVPGTIQEETKRTLENLKAIVEAAGSSLDKVVKVNVYLRDIRDFAGMNEIYITYFNKDAPVRTTIQAAALPLGIGVEIDCIARK